MNGEYTGKDGKKRRWFKWGAAGYSPEEWYEDLGHWSAGRIPPADWPAAKAALDELIGEEESEWVEWEVDGYKYRATADGDKVEWSHTCSERWFDGSHQHAAFRAGLKVRDKNVQELVDAVLEITPCVHVDEAVGEAVMLTCDWDRIRAAAEKLREQVSM